MYTVEANARLSAPSAAAVGLIAIGSSRFIARRRVLNAPTRRLLTEMLVALLASLLVALMVLLGGDAVGQTATAVAIPPSSPPLDPSTGVDIRDSVVANGMVTPWMERMNTPDPSVTP